MNRGNYQERNSIAISNESLLEYIFSIIDSKLQFTSEQMNLAIHKMENESGLDHMSSGNPQMKLEKNSKEFLLQNIEKYATTVRLLLYLRTSVNPVNVKIVFELLTGNKFLDHTEKSLKESLNPSYDDDPEL